MFESVPGWFLAPRPQHARVHGDPLGGRTKTDQHLFGQRGLALRPEHPKQIIAMAFSMAAEIERDLISQRTKEALRFKKAQGMKLRRPTGPGKSKLDPDRPEIEGPAGKRFHPKIYRPSLPNNRGQYSQLAQKAWIETVQTSWCPNLLVNVN